MDAREQLRRYLEQRREMGETELVLDSMPVDDVLRLVTGTDRAASDRRESGNTEHEDSSPRSGREAGAGAGAGGSGDWRAALRASGVEPPAPGSSGHAPPGGDARDPDISSPPPAAPPPPPRSHAPVPMPDALQSLIREIAACKRCPLYATATNPVPGEGNPNADLMCVGEAPGATEDQTGRPFVGAAGQLLTKILAAIDLAREDVYICNVLKHRPPGNRNPAPDEVFACSPYLIRQIEIVRPKVILALGTFAAQTLLETKLSIGKLRGQIHSYQGVPLVVTYHPAALLRNPGWKRPTWEDVQLARRVLDSAITNA